jgi:hypothetical protein
MRKPNLIQYDITRQKTKATNDFCSIETKVE